MFCLEGRILRELYWAGFGFQVWCQMLTHASRAQDANIFIVDEPEIYLHPDVQRQLLGILRELGPEILLATHSTEIMSEADPSEIIVIDKNKRRGQRLRDIQGIQSALELIGSVQNITLTRLARNRRVLFVEDDSDFTIIRQFARQVGLAEPSAGTDITPVASGGFSSWERVRDTGWGFQKTLGSILLLGTVYDRDYQCEEHVDAIIQELKRRFSGGYP
jgi:predicted ATP-dependent endonuclease of OLD family